MEKIKDDDLILCSGGCIKIMYRFYSILGKLLNNLFMARRAS